MKYEVNLNGNEKYIVLEIITKRNGKIITRQEIDNEVQIKQALDILMPSVKKINKLKNDTIEIPLPENSKLTISNYSIIKNYDALSEINEYFKKIRQEKNQRKKIGYASILALSTAATILISMFQKEHEEYIPMKVEAKPIMEYDLEDEITVLNTSNLLYASPNQTVYLETEVDEVEDQLFLQDLFPEIGSKKEDPRKQNVKNEYSALTEKYATISGIDQELIQCILSQERGFHSSEKDKGGAIGVAQIQVSHHEGEKLYLRNKLTGKTESFIVTKEMIKDLEGNIKICATLLQNKLDYYNGNTLVAVQSYNFGYGATDKFLKLYSDISGKTIDEILNDPTNIEWITSVKTYSDSRDGYGDDNYCQNVLNFYEGETFTIKYNKDGKNEVITVKIDDLEQEKSHGI